MPDLAIERIQLNIPPTAQEPPYEKLRVQGFSETPISAADVKQLLTIFVADLAQVQPPIPELKDDDIIFSCGRSFANHQTYRVSLTYERRDKSTKNAKALGYFASR